MEEVGYVAPTLHNKNRARIQPSKKTYLGWEKKEQK